jgi:hypothetical protein
VRYSVSYETDAIAALTQLWLDAVDRASVTAAQATLDHRLASDPHGNGSQISEGLWAIECHPLRAFYEIIEDDRLVLVTALRRLP